MGIFSTKKKIFVASVTYNMAGDYPDRMVYVKTAAIGTLMGATNTTFVGEGVNNALHHGPYTAQRNLLRWAKTHYAEGIPKAYFGNISTLGLPEINLYLYDLLGTQLVNAESAEAGPAQAYWWAYQWILINRPYIERSEWSFDLFSNNPNNAIVVVYLADGTTHNVVMQGFNQTSQYAYIRYTPLHIEDINGFPTTVIDEPRIAIYRFGSGNPIMESIKPPTSAYGQEFMPFMPIRIDNRFIDNGDYKTKYYEKCKKFYKKASGGKKIKELIDTINENEKIGDIDYAYMIYGVSLNTKTKSGKRYLFEFMRTLLDRQTVTTQAYNKWVEDIDKAMVIYAEIQRLYKLINEDSGGHSRMAMASSSMAARSDGEGGQGGNDPEGLWQAYERNLRDFQRQNPGDPPYNVISQRSDWLPNDFQINHMWISNQSVLLTGLQNPGRKVGDIWLELLPSMVIPTPEIIFRREPGGGSEIEYSSGTESIPVFNIYRQVSVGAAERIRVTGLTQQNIVYKGKDVWTDARNALTDNEESSLVVPIHMPTLKKISLKDRCQVGVENSFVVFNCYEVVKIRWYQRGIFKIVFAIALAILAVVFFPPAAGFAGIFGSAASIGASLGLSGLAGAIVGAAINAIAAMFIMQMTQGFATAMFGAEFGAIIGMVLGFVIMSGMSNLFSTGSFTVNWGNLISIDNIMKFTDALGRGYQAHVANNIAKMGEELTEFTNWAENEMRKIQDKMLEMFGIGNLATDMSQMLLDAAKIYNESPNTFMTRTMMTGTDMAELSNGMITNFAALSLTLPDARQ